MVTDWEAVVDRAVFSKAKRLARAEPDVTAWWACFLNWAVVPDNIARLQRVATKRYGKTKAGNLIQLHAALINDQLPE